MSNTKLPALKDALDLLNQTQDVLGRFVANHRNPSEKDTISELLGMHDCAAGYAARKAVSETLALLADRERQAGEAVAWENFPAYLIDHCEGETISEEGLQRALSDMLKLPQYASLPAPQAVQAESMRERLQKQCSAWGAYWRASDAHGVELTKPQAIELLQDALGVEVEIKDNGCQACDGTGMIGGRSYYSPEEGGVPCPDCAAPSPDGKAEEPMRYFPPGSFQTSKAEQAEAPMYTTDELLADSMAMREALRKVKYQAASLADAQVIALEALTAQPTASNAGEQPDMRRDDSQRHGPDWDAFNVAYEAVCARSISLREIAWRCYRAALASKATASNAGERESLTLDIKSAIAELASGAVYPDLLEAIDKLAALATQPQPCGHPASLLLTSAETGEPLYCEACDDKSGRRDAEASESELMSANRALLAEIAEMKGKNVRRAEITSEEWEWLKHPQSAKDLADFVYEYAARSVDGGAGPDGRTIDIKCGECDGTGRAALATKPPAGEQKPVQKGGQFTRAWLKLDKLPGAMMTGPNGPFGPVPASCSAWVTTSEGERDRLMAQGHSMLTVYTAPQPEQVAQDSARLDWLCQQFVTVRIPLRYGSRECFMGSPDDNDGESVPWDIRSKIDAARASRQEAEKQ